MRDYILSLCAHDDYPITLKDAHTHIVIRSVAYLKICFSSSDDVEPSVTATYDPADLVKKHRFLEYAALLDCSFQSLDDVSDQWETKAW